MSQGNLTQHGLKEAMAERWARERAELRAKPVTTHRAHFHVPCASHRETSRRAICRCSAVQRGAARCSAVQRGAATASALEILTGEIGEPRARSFLWLCGSLHRADYWLLSFGRKFSHWTTLLFDLVAA